MPTPATAATAAEPATGGDTLTETTSKPAVSTKTAKTVVEGAAEACAPAVNTKQQEAGTEEITKYEDSTVEYIVDEKSMGQGKLKITTRLNVCIFSLVSLM